MQISHLKLDADALCERAISQSPWRSCVAEELLQKNKHNCNVHKKAGILHIFAYFYHLGCTDSGECYPSLVGRRTTGTALELIEHGLVTLNQWSSIYLLQVLDEGGWKE